MLFLALIALFVFRGNFISAEYDRYGQVVIYFPTPHASQCTGGTAALHQLEHQLLKLRVRANYPHCSLDCYGHLYDCNNNTKDIESSKQSSKNIVVVPEIFSVSDFFSPSFRDLLPSWQAESSRVVIWTLAALRTAPPNFNTELLFDLSDLTHGVSLVFANSHYIHINLDLLWSTRFVLYAPLTPLFYSLSMNQDFSALVARRTDSPTVVLFDDDYLADIVPAVLDAASSERVKFIELGGLSFDELVELYSVAKVVVDLYVPGFERVVQEASLFGAVPVLARMYNSRDRVDFDLPEELLFDPYSVEDQLRAIEFAVNNYFTLVHCPQLVAFREKVRDLESGQGRVLQELLASSRVMIVAQSCSDEEDDLAIAFALAALHHNPLASIEVFVRDVTAFLVHHVTVLRQLAQHGLTSLDGGQDFHSLRFRSMHLSCGFRQRVRPYSASQSPCGSAGDSFQWTDLNPSVLHGNVIIRSKSVCLLVPPLQSIIESVTCQPLRIGSGHSDGVSLLAVLSPDVCVDYNRSGGRLIFDDNIEYQTMQSDGITRLQHLVVLQGVQDLLRLFQHISTAATNVLPQVAERQFSLLTWIELSRAGLWAGYFSFLEKWYTH